MKKDKRKEEDKENDQRVEGQTEQGPAQKKNRNMIINIHNIWKLRFSTTFNFKNNFADHKIIPFWRWGKC